MFEESESEHYYQHYIKGMTPEEFAKKNAALRDFILVMDDALKAKPRLNVNVMYDEAEALVIQAVVFVSRYKELLRHDIVHENIHVMPDTIYERVMLRLAKTVGSKEDMTTIYAAEIADCVKVMNYLSALTLLWENYFLKEED